MVSSVKLLARCLEAEKQREILVELSNNIEKNISVICEVIDELDQDVVSEIYPQIVEYGTQFLKNIEEKSIQEYAEVETLYSKVPELQQSLIIHFYDSLKSYQDFNVSHFEPGYLDLFQSEKSGGPTDITRERIVSCLQFMEHFCRESQYDHPPSDWLLMSYLGAEDNTLSLYASKILYWRIAEIFKHEYRKLFWEAVFKLETSSNKSIKGHSYVMWLRYLQREELINDEEHQELLSDENYWKTLQRGLISNSHEHRKISLSILKASISTINRDISTKVFNWKLDSKDLYHKEWFKFITLFELLGIDTSLHQIEAATNDLFEVMSPQSLIHSFWGFGLLSIGFKASMDSVRKFSLRVLMSMPASHLYLIGHSLSLLEESFLPYAMVASHFVVDSNESGKERCLYGESLARFIASILKNLDDIEAGRVVESLLNLLVTQRGCFDPARIYVSFGLLKGIESRRVLTYSSHSKYMVPLFETKSEGFLYQKTSQTINMKLLLCFKYESPTEFLDLIAKFTKINGFEIFKTLSSAFFKFIKSTDTIYQSLNRELRNNNDAYKSFLIFFFIDNLKEKDEKAVNEVLSKPEEFWLLVLNSKLNFPVLKDPKVLSLVSKLFEKALNGEYDPNACELLSDSNIELLKQFWKTSYSTRLWLSIVEDLKSDAFYVLNAVSSKIKLLNTFSEATGIVIPVREVIAINDCMLCNSKEVARDNKIFYKIKDSIYGGYFKMLFISSYYSDLTESDSLALMKIVSSEMSHYESNLSIVKLTQVILEHSRSVVLIEKVVSFVFDLWQNLDSSRLQLNQKDLQVEIICVLYSSKVMKESLHSTSIAKKILDFGKSVLTNAHGRRSLLPTLTRRLSDFQIANEKAFETLSWAPEMIVKAFVLHQLRSNGFKLEVVVGMLFDEEISSEDYQNLYESVYGPQEVAARVDLMTICNSISSEEFALKVFQYIIKNESQFNLFSVVKNTDGLEEWTRMQLFTILVSISSMIDKDKLSNELGCVKKFISLLETEPSPLVRFYLEWIIALNLDETYTDHLFQSLINDSNMKPSVMTSYERILFLMIREKADPKDWILKLLSIIIPGSSSNKALTRHFSLSLVCSIYEEVKSREIELDPSMLAILENAYASVIRSDSYGQFRSGDAILWDIRNDLNLVAISGGLLLRLSDRTDFDFIPKEIYLEHLTSAQKSILKREIGENQKDLWVIEKFKGKKSIGMKTTSDRTPLQTKSSAQTSLVDSESAENSKRVVRSDLIVVSSLVDKAPNLGGICRLCDVLGAGLLTLNDIRIKNNPQFKSVAVTADQWMPMTEVRAENINSFLREKKKDGYFLIGLEQTDNSIELNSDFKFPSKSLVVLGAEKEGIRGDLLAELDVCLEIKQVGVVRSMNIQTATAIIVHAYSSQHC